MTRLARFASVGALGYARSHLAYLRRFVEEGKGELVAVMLIDRADCPEIAAALEEQGTQIYDNYQAMLDSCRDEVDIVFLPTPIHLHAPMSVAAFQAGYHVFVEKPIAGSLSEVDRLIAVRDDKHRQCAVGFQFIYSPIIQTLKRYACAGRLGRIQWMRIVALWPRNPTYYARNNWAGKLYVDGKPVFDSPFHNALSHQIMNMLYLASPQPGKAAYPMKTEAELYRAYDIESFDTGCMRVQTDSDVEVVFAASHACNANLDPVMRIAADEATVDYRIGDRATITYHDGTIEVLEPSDPRAHMFQNVTDVVIGAAPEPLCTPEIARAHVACTTEIHKAAEIVSVTPELVSMGDNGQRVIAGVEEAVRQVFATGLLFSDLDAPFVP
jgi:predicted dehydrogenase